MADKIAGRKALQRTLLCSGAYRTFKNYSNLLRIAQILRFEIVDSRFFAWDFSATLQLLLSKFRGFYHMREVPNSTAGFHSSRFMILCAALLLSTALLGQTPVPAESSAQNGASSEAATA